MDLYNEHIASNALQKHEMFVKKAHGESQKIKDKADDILHDIEEAQERLKQKEALFDKIRREMEAD